MENLLQFLSALKQNNNRDWFQANKDWYLESKKEHEALVANIILGISGFEPGLQLLKPSECVFRIYRDVRFSKNKEPYKTAMGAVFSNGGRKSKYAGYYLHLEPGNSFAGGGIWRPESDALKNIRYEIYNHPDEFMGILEKKDFKNTFGELIGEKLKRPPKDFPANFEHIEILKYKSLTVGKSFSDKELTDNTFVKRIINTFETMRPFIGFLNRGIDA